MYYWQIIIIIAIYKEYIQIINKFILTLVNNQFHCKSKKLCLNNN